MNNDGVDELGRLHAEDMAMPPDDFLQNEPEGSIFHKAFQASEIEGFDCRYLAVFRDGQRVALVPYFLGELRLNTMLSDGLFKLLLSPFKIRIACVGHPSMDFGLIDGEISADILALVNVELGKKAALIAYKGFTGKLPLPGFVCARGLPVPVLTLKGDYYSELDGHRRNDFKHKLEKAQPLHIDECSNLPEHLLPQVFKLYLNTYSQAPLKFEKLTLAYFRETAPISKYLLFFEADALIGFVQIIGKNKKAVFKYVGMDYRRNRQYGLYYVMCLKCIETCLRDGYKHLELGVTSYHFKRLLGSQMVETSIYYRHNNALIHWLIGKLKFLLEPDEDELC